MRLGPIAVFLLAAATVVPQALSQSVPARTDGAADAQRVAMQKLSFLVGTWAGPITIRRGPGEPLHLIQTEHVQMKLDGLVLLIEGSSTDAAGKVRFQALATVSYDSVGTYRFRAFNDGKYIDAELKVPDRGFSWGFQAGPARITNGMHLTAAGEWAEETDAVIDGGTPQRSMDMLLKRQP